MNLNVELMEEVRQQAFDECMDLSESVISSMLGPDGETVGDKPLDRGQRIARVEDMSRRGVMDMLKTISPPVYEKIVRQFIRDIKDSPFMETSPENEADDWHGTKSRPVGEVESERTWDIDPSQLPELPKPWIIIQAYRTPEESIRLIPARRLAFARLKQPGTQSLSRNKTSVKFDYDEAAKEVISDMPLVAVKERYLIRDETGRAWLIDHMLTHGGAWRAETELSNPNTPVNPPPGAIRELTDSPEGYTYNFAVPMPFHERAQYIRDADTNGNRESYTPGEDPSFRWQE